MTPLVLNIPDEPAQLPLWLERRLVGFDLATLVAELSAVHGARAGNAPQLAEVLGDRRAEVLSSGLAALPEEMLQQLLLRPELLFELQDFVLAHGGNYWDEVLERTEAEVRRSTRGKRRLQRFIETDGGEPTARPALLPIRSARWYSRPAFVSLTTAAAVFIAVFAYERFAPVNPPAGGSSVAWGWAKSGAIPQDVSREAYLNTLAEEADQWFKQRPGQPAALAQHINEFRQGCSALLLSEHKPLPAADKDWLLERCRVWAGKLDVQLAALESGQDALAVETATDEIVRKLSDALRARAKTVAG